MVLGQSGFGWRWIAGFDKTTLVFEGYEVQFPRGNVRFSVIRLVSCRTHSLLKVEVFNHQDPHAMLCKSLVSPSLQELRLPIHTFFANRLYSWTKAALFPTSSVSLNKPRSPLLVVQVLLVHICGPLFGTFRKGTLCGKLKDPELADGSIRRGGIAVAAGWLRRVSEFAKGSMVAI